MFQPGFSCICIFPVATGTAYAETFQNEKLISLDELCFEKTFQCPNHQGVCHNSYCGRRGVSLKSKKKATDCGNCGAGPDAAVIGRRWQGRGKGRNVKGQGIPVLPQKGMITLPVHLNLFISSDSAFLNFRGGRGQTYQQCRIFLFWCKCCYSYGTSNPILMRFHHIIRRREILGMQHFYGNPTNHMRSNGLFCHMPFQLCSDFLFQLLRN